MKLHFFLTFGFGVGEDLIFGPCIGVGATSVIIGVGDGAIVGLSLGSIRPFPIKAG
jgi:hypothetical protein